jgi:hypothetical protein
MFHITPSVIRSYYLFATPAFWLADIAWDAPVRASFIPDHGLRYFYYACCMVCGFVMGRQPWLIRVIGMSESVFSFTMAILSIWMPIMGVYDAILAGGVEPTLDPAQPINAGISGLAAVMSFYARQRA